MENQIGAIILAAGKGSRMGSTQKNKVTEDLGGKPIIVHAVDLLESVHVTPIIVVVGFAKESVKKVLGNRVIYAEQTEQLGTGHAAGVAMGFLPKNISHVIIFNGDDSAFYSKETISTLISTQIQVQAAITLLTITLPNPSGLGRIKRDGNKNIAKIIEEKDATEEELKITEINPGCYIFSVEFLIKFLPKIEKSVVTDEYYLTSLIDMAIVGNQPIATVTVQNIYWRGVNTKQELEQARQIYISSIIK